MEHRPANLPAHYEVLESLHEGSRGAVLKVHNRLVDEVRVLKVLRPEVVANPSFRRHFATLARDLPQIEHPNLVKVHGIHLVDQGEAYLEMEFVEGRDLGQWLADGERPSIEASLGIARQALEALSFLHQHERVHGVISPDHLLVAGENGDRQVKLLHTGVVAALDVEHGEFLGRSWHYASPELRIPGRHIQPASDTYSLGLVLCQLLADIDPYSDEESANLDRILANGKVDLPTPLRNLLRRAVREHPDERFACAGAFSEALAAAAGSLAEGQTTTAAKTTAGDPSPTAEIDVAEPLPDDAGDPVETATEIASSDPDAEQLAEVAREAQLGPLVGAAARQLLSGEYDTAERQIEQALAIDPTHRKALALLAQLQQRRAESSFSSPVQTHREPPRREADTLPARLDADAQVTTTASERAVRFPWLAGGVLLAIVFGVLLFFPKPSSPPEAEVAPPSVEPTPPTRTVDAARPEIEPRATPETPAAAAASDRTNREIGAGDPVAPPPPTPTASSSPTSTERAGLEDEDATGGAPSEPPKAVRETNDGAVGTLAEPPIEASTEPPAEPSVEAPADASTEGVGPRVASANAPSADAGERVATESTPTETSSEPSLPSAESGVADPAPSRVSAAPRPLAELLADAERPPSDGAPGETVAAIPANETAARATISTSSSSIPEPLVVEPPPLALDVQQSRIRVTLDRFERAHQALDMAALRAIWPTLEGSELQTLSESFAGARSIRTRVRNCRYSIERATAAANCQVDQTHRPVGGRRQSVERLITFHLRRAGDVWMIDSLGPGR